MCGCGQYIIQKYSWYKAKYIKGHNIGKGSNNMFWKGGRKKVRKYWYVYKPNHPFATKYGYVLEHRLVYEHYLKILFDEDVYIPKEIDIHHIDGNKENNFIQNLQPLYKFDHMRLEMKGKKNAKKYKH